MSDSYVIRTFIATPLSSPPPQATYGLAHLPGTIIALQLGSQPEAITVSNILERNWHAGPLAKHIFSQFCCNGKECGLDLQGEPC